MYEKVKQPMDILSEFSWKIEDGSSCDLREFHIIYYINEGMEKGFLRIRFISRTFRDRISFPAYGMISILEFTTRFVNKDPTKDLSRYNHIARMVQR